MRIPNYQPKEENCVTSNEDTKKDFIKGGGSMSITAKNNGFYLQLEEPEIRLGGNKMLSTQDMINPLLDLGLNKYEAKVYLTLVAEGISTAKNISDITGIPYGKVYEIINSLAAKGFSLILPSKPIKCRAVSPQDAISSVRKETLEKLDKLEKTMVDELNPLFAKTKKFMEPKSIFWVVNGRSNINKKLENIILTAEKSLSIFISENGLKRLVFLKESLEAAHNRGIEINIITKATKENAEDCSSLSFCNIRHLNNGFSNHLFSNGSESIIVEPVPDDDEIIHGRDIGIWVMSPSFTKFMENFFVSYFKKSKEINSEELTKQKE